MRIMVVQDAWRVILHLARYGGGDIHRLLLRLAVKWKTLCAHNNDETSSPMYLAMDPLPEITAALASRITKSKEFATFAKLELEEQKKNRPRLIGPEKKSCDKAAQDGDSSGRLAPIWDLFEVSSGNSVSKLGITDANQSDTTIDVDAVMIDGSRRSANSNPIASSSKILGQNVVGDTGGSIQTSNSTGKSSDQVDVINVDYINGSGGFHNIITVTSSSDIGEQDAVSDMGGSFPIGNSSGKSSEDNNPTGLLENKVSFNEEIALRLKHESQVDQLESEASSIGTRSSINRETPTRNSDGEFEVEGRF